VLDSLEMSWPASTDPSLQLSELRSWPFSISDPSLHGELHRGLLEKPLRCDHPEVAEFARARAATLFGGRPSRVSQNPCESNCALGRLCSARNRTTVFAGPTTWIGAKGNRSLIGSRRSARNLRGILRVRAGTLALAQTRRTLRTSIAGTQLRSRDRQAGS